MTDKRTLGLAKFKELSPTGAEKIKDLLEDTAPGTYAHVLEVAFGDLYQRTNLDPKIRQTVSLVALAAANQHDLCGYISTSRASSASPRRSSRRSSSRWRRSRDFRDRCLASAP